VAEAKANPLGAAFSPFAIFGALGVLAFARDALEWQKDLLTWLDAWRFLTHTVIDVLFGWIPPLLHFFSRE